EESIIVYVVIVYPKTRSYSEGKWRILVKKTLEVWLCLLAPQHKFIHIVKAPGKDYGHVHFETRQAT
ncbi:5371_t:CDS:1, partial [Ambispora gerdemannii]